MTFKNGRCSSRCKTLLLASTAWFCVVLLRGPGLSGQETEDTRHPLPPFAKQLEAAKLLEETQDIRNLDTSV